ncbi:hypothetical protein C8E05_3168 [Rhodococcus wratislaviensis]|uniref:Transcriptional regulator, AbiEi antitoxin, Type IV TA system n=2 Tax=Rhodococcus TaxID=1827 RepID=A0AB38FJD9_RHOWR|nr:MULTISPECIES: hypothetical protein [Rhodococcus]AII06381.1 hypothetical protein EP51_17890 [Rhodococcus opacus]REE73750.1 hypothetical protein C8E05_3168 [Rhodococcus wratislaviensis]SPZ41611.1 Uncharacterised protein [Rhodococcus wratislaviensis]
MRRGIWGQRPELLDQVGVAGVVRTSELERLGLARSTISARCRSGGPWQRLLPGIVLLQNGQPSFQHRVLAARLFCGRDSLVTGRSALRCHGFGSYSGDVDVLVAVDRRVQSTGFVKVERTSRMPDADMRGNIACAPLPRALLDAARRCTTVDAARATIAEVVQRGAVTAEELVVELEAGSGRGSAIPRIVLREMTANVHSVSEAHARRLWLRSGLPEMVFNRKIVDIEGRFIAMPDGWIDEVAFAWDIDSLDWHLAPQQYKHTVERRTRMQNAGIIVLPTLPSAVRDQPERVIADLRAHFELAASRPRPNVRMLP